MKPRPSILVTGAAGSLGLETALALAGRGFGVFAGARRAGQQAAIREAAAKRGLSLETVALDLTDPSSVAEAVRAAADSPGGLFGLVNNAAVNLRGYFEDLAEDEVRRLFEVNLFGTLGVTRQALPYLRAAGRGRIVVMSSVAGRIGSMGLTAYVASKFALEGFAESLSLEVGPLGIRVALVEPGIVKTDVWGKNRWMAVRALDPASPYRDWFERAEEEEADRLVRTSRITPADVAGTVLRAITDRRPRLRYTVGRRASLVMALRRYLPGETFERLYFGEVLRRVTGRRGFAGAR